MKKLLTLAISLSFFATVFAINFAKTWTIKADYNIQFASKEASGIFKTFKGSIVFDDKNLASSKFDVVVDVNSINTGNGLQNKHAKGKDWFDATTYPSIKFVSTKIVKKDAGFETTGNLEMHGVKKEISIPFTFEKTGAEGVLKGKFEVNRNDYKIGTSKSVSEIIKIDVKVPIQ